VDNFCARSIQEFPPADTLYPKSDFFHTDTVFLRYRIREIDGIDGFIGKAAASLKMLGPGGFGLDVGSGHNAPGFFEILFFEIGDKALLALRSGVRIALVCRVVLSDPLRRADAKHDLVIFAKDLPDHAFVPLVLGLEPPEEDADFGDVVLLHNIIDIPSSYRRSGQKSRNDRAGLTICILKIKVTEKDNLEDGNGGK